MANKFGEGGFAPVFKGNLPDGEEIAIKRLSKMSGQGIKEVMNELTCISNLQHVVLFSLPKKFQAMSTTHDLPRDFWFGVYIFSNFPSSSCFRVRFRFFFSKGRGRGGRKKIGAALCGLIEYDFLLKKNCGELSLV